MHMVQKFVIVSLVIVLSACEMPKVSTIPGGAIERELCIAWGESLPTRSHSDTEQTLLEIQDSYDDFRVACPAFVYLLK